MVSTVTNGVSPSETVASLDSVVAEKPEGLPAGKYALVGWDMDTTGRRLIDEICQIAAYTPTSQFSQYVMPYKNLNPGARRRYNIRVVTVGRYRILKDNRTNKVLKTKSEVSALTDFVDWLEKLKADAPDGVILIYHEARKVHPAMLLEALMKYSLWDRFKAVVAGFADGHWLAAEKCRSSVKSLSLRSLSRVLLDDGNAAGGTTAGEGDALERAAAAFRVAEHLASGERAALPPPETEREREGEGEGKAEVAPSLAAAAAAAARPLSREEDCLQELKRLLQRQNTFRPIFLPLLKASWTERVRASLLRRALAQANFNYEDLQAVWQEKQITGLETALSTLSLAEDKQKELVEILDCYFDPAKESKGAKLGSKGRYARNYQNRNKNRNGEQSGEGGANAAAGEGNDGEAGDSASPDTLSSSGSPVKTNRNDAGVVVTSSDKVSPVETAVVAN